MAWLPGLPSFTLPIEGHILDHLHLVQDLMIVDGSTWNREVLSANFPAYIHNMILDIPIEFVWIPSKIGKFTIRSSYSINNSARFRRCSDSEKRLWKLL